MAAKVATAPHPPPAELKANTAVEAKTTVVAAPAPPAEGNSTAASDGKATTVVLPPINGNAAGTSSSLAACSAAEKAFVSQVEKTNTALVNTANVSPMYV